MPLTRSQIRTRSRRRAGCLPASRRVRLGLSLSRNPRLEPSRRTVTVTRAVGPPTGAASCRTPGPPGAGGSRAASEGPSLTVMSLRSLSAVSGPDPGRAGPRPGVAQFEPPAAWPGPPPSESRGAAAAVPAVTDSASESVPAGPLARRGRQEAETLTTTHCTQSSRSNLKAPPGRLGQPAPGP